MSGQFFRALITLSALLTLALAACGGATTATPDGAGPILGVVPDRARQGDSITLSGLNWRPGAKLTLAFSPIGQAGADGDSVSLGTTTADDQGRVHFVTIVPQAATPGVWNIAAREDDSPQGTTTPFTVLAPDVTVMATGNGDLPTGTTAPTDIPAPTDTPVPAPTSAPTDTPVPPPAPTDTPPPTIAPTDTPVPPTLTPLPPSVTPHPKRPWLDARYQGNRLVLHGARYATGNRVFISLASDDKGSNPVLIGEAVVDERGVFDFTAKLSKELRKNRFVIAEDPIQGRRAIWYIEIKKGGDD